MATTPNYGWVTPAPTDFVTDLPADFEVFADAVDADLAGLLGGTTGQVLAKDSNTDHDFSWISISSGGMTQLATGTLTGSSVVISAISGSYKDLVLVVRNFRASGDLKLMMRWNGLSTGYRSTPGTFSSNTTFTNSEMFCSSTIDGGAATNSLIYVHIPDYANTATWKHMMYRALGNHETTPANVSWEVDYGLSNSNSAISSITLLPQAGGTFTTGNYILYGVS